MTRVFRCESCGYGGNFRVFEGVELGANERGNPRYTFDTEEMWLVCPKCHTKHIIKRTAIRKTITR